MSNQLTSSLVDSLALTDQQEVDRFQSAKRIQELAASVGFDWPSIEPVIDKLYEEISELKSELGKRKETTDQKQLEAIDSDIKKEFGDILFVCVNLSRFLGLDCQESIALTNQKFIERLRYIESQLQQQGLRFEDTDLETLDALWESSKRSR